MADAPMKHVRAIRDNLQYIQACFDRADIRRTVNERIPKPPRNWRDLVRHATGEWPNEAGRRAARRQRDKWREGHVNIEWVAVRYTPDGSREVEIRGTT